MCCTKRFLIAPAAHILANLGRSAAGPIRCQGLGGSAPSTKALGMDIDRAWVLSKGFEKRPFPKEKGAEGVDLGYPLLDGWVVLDAVLFLRPLILETH